MSFKTRMWLEGTFHVFQNMPALRAWEGDLNFFDSHLTPEHPEEPWGSRFHGLVEVLSVHLNVSLALGGTQELGQVRDTMSQH